MLSREDILNYQDCEQRTVNAWGGEVRVRSMSVAQLFSFQALLNEAKATGDYSRAQCVVASWCVVDENDRPLFTEADVEALGNKSHRSLAKIFSAVVEMNTISDDSIDAKKKH